MAISLFISASLKRECWKDLALSGVLQRLGKHRLGAGHAGNRDHQPLPGQLLHQDHESGVGAAHDVLLGHKNVVEKEFAGVLRFHAQLLQRLAFAEARARGRHEEEGDVLGAGTGRGLAVVTGQLGGNQREVAMPTVGDEGLAAVEHITLTLRARHGADGLQIAAGGRLGHGDRTDGLAARHLGQPTVAQGRRRELLQVDGDDVGVHRKATQCATARARDFFQHDGTGQAAGPCAAIRFGELRAQVTQFASALPCGAVDMALGFPALLLRHGLLAQPAGQAGAEGFQLRCEQAAGQHHVGSLFGLIHTIQHVCKMNNHPLTRMRPGTVSGTYNPALARAPRCAPPATGTHATDPRVNHVTSATHGANHAGAAVRRCRGPVAWRHPPHPG
jgi:hypothetical protein